MLSVSRLQITLRGGRVDRARVNITGRWTYNRKCESGAAQASVYLPSFYPGRARSHQSHFH